LLNTEYLVDDICKLVRTSTGKIEAGKGEHDDCLMSYLIAIYIYYTGDNLEYFGINKEEHPIIGVIEPEYDSHVQERDTMAGFFNVEKVTFETIQRDSLIETEQYLKYAVTNKRYQSPGVKPDNDPFDNNVNISPFFFDQINNW
jgi:hypothetical protein